MVLVAPEKTGQALEIMLIEDSLLDARLTIEALKRCGIHHRLTLFRDGAEAIEFLYQRGVFALAPAPAIILLDLYLPDTDGVTFLRQIRTDGKLMNIPVVVLTSSDDGTNERECEMLGVSSYIRKPFNEDKFLSVIRRLKGVCLSLEAET
ncbi:MAG: response regulator [Planctomycetales bacterium]|nr:response regulator [Planctomycetales bacterium]